MKNRPKKTFPASAHIVLLIRTGICFLAAMFFSISATAATLVGGQINGQIWTAANSPYLATNDITVVSLTIQPGVTVQFGGGLQFIVTGNLQAVGAETNQIIFQPATNGIPWQGMLFSDASNNCQLQYCVVEGAYNSGIRLVGTPLTIQNCMIIDNTASNGGGINTDGSITLQCCLVSGNSTYSGGGTASGGGIYSSGGGSTIVTLQQSIVNGNSISAVSANGAGIACNGGVLILNDSTISDNSANGNQCADSFCHNYASGGGVYTGGSISGQGTTISGNSVGSGDVSSGAGLYSAGSITLTNCDVSGNAGSSSYGGSVGGGIRCGGILQLQACRISGNSVSFTGCCAGPSYYGSAIYVADSAYDVIQNCIISGNYVGYANGIYFGPAVWFQGSTGTASILNTVFYGNSIGAIYGGTGTIENSIFYDNSVGSPGLNINYSLVLGGYAGTGNVDDSATPVNSLFTDTTYFFLASGSPAIDAGDPNPAFNDVRFPPAQGGLRNDMGVYGGPGVIQNSIFISPLQITTPPATQTVNFGSTVNLSAGIISSVGVVSYQWSFNGTNIVGATNATLTIPNFSSANVGAYSVTVSDFDHTVTSSSALVNVTTLNITFYPGVTINGVAGQTYLLQSTPALGSGSGWINLTNITLTAPSYIYFDSRGPTNPAQYYRTLLQ